MASAFVKWVQNKQFVGTDSTNHSIVLSTSDEGTGMRPSELILVALASCTAVDVVEILAKKRTPVELLEISVSGEQDADPPWTFRKIYLKYVVKGNGITEKGLEQAIHLSETGYCSVAATLRGVAEITTSYELLP